MLIEHVLGCPVEDVDVVLAVVEEVADLLERHRSRRRSAVGCLAPVCVELGFGGYEAPVESGDRATDVGHSGDELGDLRARDVAAVWCGGKCVGQVGDQARVGVGREVVGVEVELAGECEKYADGDRPLIVLELIDVAGRLVDSTSECGLRESLLVAKSA